MIYVEFYNGKCGYSIQRYSDNTSLNRVMEELSRYVDDRYAYVTVDDETYLVTRCNVERVER